MRPWSIMLAALTMKRVAWLSRCISMHACGSDPIVMEHQWVALWTTRTLPQKLKQLFRVHFVFDVSKTYCLNIIIRPLSTSFWRQGWSWIIAHLINKASLLYGAVKSVQQLLSSLVLSCLWRMPKNWYSCLLHPILSDIYLVVPVRYHRNP